MLCFFILLIIAMIFGAVSSDHVQAVGLMQRLATTRPHLESTPVDPTTAPLWSKPSGMSTLSAAQAKGKAFAEAFQLYEKLLPRIVFGLQNFELWLYCEKRLLQARGLLSNAQCRDATLTPDPDTARYVDELNDRLMEVEELRSRVLDSSTP